MAKPEAEQAAGLCLACAPLERLDNAGAGAPADMKPRHRVAVAHGVVAAALGPADHREDAVAHGAQPVAFLARGKRHIGLGPAPRPVIVVAVEAGRPHPVLQRQVVTVLDAEPALLGRINQEQSAERPEGLAAEALLALLLDHDDASAGVGNFGRRDQAREPAADHNDISLIGHRFAPLPSTGLKPAALTAVNGKYRLDGPRGSLPGRLNVPVWDTGGRGCIPRATLDLNLIGTPSAIWTKPRSRNTLVTSCITQDSQIRVRQVLDWGWL